ncbi:hypothetical protein [Thermus sp.]|uniref:hypothetical protein n=1 Tax=Thermus sp. TaxID=275 RepID=UPI00260A981F|nr:hypothetical protein [Thermus sp.]MCX7851032.1 hypothetical protein [Thermus sp.]
MLKLTLAQAARQAGFEPTALPPELRPGAWLQAQGVDLEALVEEELAQMDLQVWQGGSLPNGLPAPAEAVPGAAYWIATPSGTAIFQYGTSPYTPQTPGLMPGELTPENAEAAMQAHARALAEEAVRQRLSEAYLAHLAEALL